MNNLICHALGILLFLFQFNCITFYGYSTENIDTFFRALI